MFSIDLQRSVFRARGILEGLSDKELSYYVDRWAGVMLLTFSVGAFFGISFFSWITHYLGRRSAFAICYVLAMLSTAFVCLEVQHRGRCFLDDPHHGLLTAIVCAAHERFGVDQGKAVGRVVLHDGAGGVGA